MSGTTVLRTLIAALFAAAAYPAHADSWMPPQPQTYLSPNGQVRLRVIPRSITSPLDYFSDKTKGKEPAGQKPNSTQKTARGVLERVSGDGKWQPVWDHPLVNEVAPVGAEVANDGRIVTFDNWHRMGYGPDAVVVYDGGGQKIRALSLADILPQDYVTALPHTISSIWWHGKPRVSEDGQKLILPVVVPQEKPDLSRDADYAEIAIRLADGAVIEPQSPAWADALAQARKVAAHKRAQDEELRKFFTEPLRGPRPPTEPGWHQYLREAFYRLDPGVKLNLDEDGASVGTQVLRSPDAPDYGPSEKWLREAMLEKRDSDHALAIASLAPPEHVLKLMESIVSGSKPGRLKGSRTYIALPAAYRDRAIAILSRIGTQVIFLDPAVPIPQRPERLKRFLGSDG